MKSDTFLLTFSLCLLMAVQTVWAGVEDQLEAEEQSRAPGLQIEMRDVVTENKVSPMGTFDEVFLAELTKAEGMSAEALSNYEQPKLKYVDPTGDLSLLKLTKKTEGILTRILFGLDQYSIFETTEIEDQCPIVPLECSDEAFKAYAKNLAEKKKNPFIASIEKPFDSSNFIQKLQLIMSQEVHAGGVPPRQGLSHEWSGVFLSKYHYLLNDELQIPKLLHALAMGVSYKYLKTGLEEKLMAIILAQPDDSITLFWLYKQSYTLNRGDVYATLLTIENILSRHWQHRKRELLPVTRRLKSFIRGTGNDTDKFGNWYHLFGMMLYGYYVGDQPSAMQASSIAKYESLGGVLLGSHRHQQKEWVNVLGAEVGAKLKQAILAHTQ